MFSVLKLTDEQILEDEFDALRLTPENVFYPTQASVKLPDGTVFGKCLRQVYYEKVGAPRKPKPTKALRIFDFGNIFEEHEIELYKKAGIFVRDHVKFGFTIADIPGYGKVILSGEVDVIVKEPQTNRYIGVELKTGHGDNFYRQHIKGYSDRYSRPLKYLTLQTGVAPKIEHLLQAGLYLYFFKYKSDIRIDEWHIVYMARDILQGAEYVIDLEERGALHYLTAKKIYDSEKGETDEDIPLVDIAIEWVLDRYVEAAVYVAQHRVPPRDYHPTAEGAALQQYFTEGRISKYRYNKLSKDPSQPLDWQCEYCDFREQCLKDG